ncbi:hypothetical protein DRO21_04660 [archaeon]|nr:MAG: hypothetical protein DRO21_04660 [archaeon]
MSTDKLTAVVLTLFLLLSISFTLPPADIYPFKEANFTHGSLLQGNFTTYFFKETNSPIYVIGLEDHAHVRIFKGELCVVEDIIRFAELRAFNIGRGGISVYSNSCILILPSLNGSCWFPSISGFYAGRKFIITPTVYGKSSITLLAIAFENSIVKIYDAESGEMILETHVNSLFYKIIDSYPGGKLKPGKTYIIESSGDILIGCVGDSCYNYAISPRGKFIDTLLYGLALSSPPLKLSGFEIYSLYDDTVVEVRDLMSGSRWVIELDKLSDYVIYDKSINGHLLKFKSNKPIVAIVFASSNNFLSGMTYIGSNAVGKRFLFKLHNEESKAIIHTENCTWIKVNGEICTIHRKYIALNGTGLYYIEAPRKVSIQIFDGKTPFDAGVITASPSDVIPATIVDDNVWNILCEEDEMSNVIQECKAYDINILFTAFNQDFVKVVDRNGFRFSLIARENGIRLVACTPFHIQYNWSKYCSQFSHNETLIRWLESITEVNNIVPTRSFTGVLLWIELDSLFEENTGYYEQYSAYIELLNLIKEVKSICEMAELELFVTCSSKVLENNVPVEIEGVKCPFLQYLANLTDYILLLERTDNPMKIVSDIQRISRLISSSSCKLLVSLNARESSLLNETLHDEGVQAIFATFDILSSFFSKDPVFYGIVIENFKSLREANTSAYVDIVTSHAPTLLYDSLESMYPQAPFAPNIETVYFYIVNYDRFYVIEYWLYYSKDTFNVSGLAHEHDVEFIFLWVDKVTFKIAYLASSYYNWVKLYKAPQNLSLYVDLGSHSMAANMNQLLKCNGAGRKLELSDLKFLPLQCLLVNLTAYIYDFNYLKSEIGVPFVKHPWAFSFTQFPLIERIEKLNASLNEIFHNIATIEVEFEIQSILDITLSMDNNVMIISDINDTLIEGNMIYSNRRLLITYPSDSIKITIRSLEGQSISFSLVYQSYNLTRKLIVKDIAFKQRWMISIEFNIKDLYRKDRVFKLMFDTNGDWKADFSLVEDYILDREEFLSLLYWMRNAMFVTLITIIVILSVVAATLTLRYLKTRRILAAFKQCPVCGEPLVHLKFRGKLYCPKCNKYYDTRHISGRGAHIDHKKQAPP